MKVNQKGFSVLEILAIIVILGLIGAAGWLVFDRQKKSSNETSQASQQESSKDVTTQTETAKKVNRLTLDGNKVNFVLPETWTYVKIVATAHQSGM